MTDRFLPRGTAGDKRELAATHELPLRSRQTPRHFACRHFALSFRGKRISFIAPVCAEAAAGRAARSRAPIV